TERDSEGGARSGVIWARVGGSGADRIAGNDGRVRERVSAGGKRDRRGGAGGATDQVCDCGVEPERHIERTDDDGGFFWRHRAGNGGVGGESVLPGVERERDL